MTSNRTFGGHTGEEVVDLLDGLCRAADRCEANSQQEIAAIAARGRDALRALLAKPAATREEVEKRLETSPIDAAWNKNTVLHVLDALSHFAPPARRIMRFPTILAPMAPLRPARAADDDD